MLTPIYTGSFFFGKNYSGLWSHRPRLDSSIFAQKACWISLEELKVLAWQGIEVYQSVQTDDLFADEDEVETVAEASPTLELAPSIPLHFAPLNQPFETIQSFPE